MPSGSVPSAAARSAICSGARGAMKAIARGRIAALVSRVRAAADADQGLADDVVEGEQRRSRSRSRRGSSRARGRRGRARSRSWSSAVAISSAPRSAAIRETGLAKRRVERVGAVGEGVHRAGPQLAPRAGSVIASGSAITRLGRTRPVDAVLGAGREPVDRRSSRPPRASSGSPRRAAPVTEATAFAVSITRPPPRATRRLAPAALEQPPRPLRGPGPRRPRGPRTAASASSARRRQRRARW